MDFRLVYEGSLKSSGNSARHVDEKHNIRKAFHIQLAELYERHPSLRHRKTYIREEDRWTEAARKEGEHFADAGASEVETMARRFARCGFRFVPLVNKRLELVCSLDILFLRRENPGDLILRGGDVDNRIKTLLDALRLPADGSELPANCAPEADEDPFFCLLENDSLVTALNVTTDRLLTPLKPGQRENEVVLLVHVKIRATQVGLENLGLLD